MATKWTDEQQQVIDLHNRNILVSAAAGSGKTAVLVERIMEMIADEKNHVDIDQLVIVTFTNAAAREMKERILAGIELRLETEPENVHLRRQQSLIEHAQITTIDSFCLNVIRNYFSEIDLDPGFKVADEGELKLMMTDVMDAMLEDYYEEGNPEFYDFVECFTPEKTDANLGEYILNLYRAAQSNPWPKEWLLSCKENYQCRSVEEFIATEPIRYLMEEVRKQLISMEEMIDTMMECACQPDGPYMYMEALNDDRTFVRMLLEQEKVNEIYELIQGHTYARLSTKKDLKVDEDKKNRVKFMRDTLKKAIAKMKDDYLKPDWNREFEAMEQCKKHISIYVDMALEFMRRFDEQKKKKNVINFNDMEHLALNILVQKVGDKLHYTHVADELSRRYHEILIDEYQDSNLVQEIILNSISRERYGQPNVFMVGDVKQSIYRFRLARPELFIEKYDQYSPKDSLYQKIELHHNFRSRSEVLESVNAVFDKIMRKDFGKVSYDENTRLYPAATFPERPDGAQPAGGRSQLFLLEHEDDAMMSDLEAETMVCGSEIRRLMEEGAVCLDKETKTYRPVRYQDMVILMRSGRKNAEVVVNMLAQMGIPAHAQSQAGYFDAHEILVVMQFLRVIDNPRQDIALVGALKSYFGSFNSTELAKIRTKYPDKDFYDSLVLYEAELRAGETEVDDIRMKIRRFLDLLEEYRKQTEYLPIHELLWNLVYDTGYYAYLGTMPLGQERQANIDMLIEKAKGYENTSFHGLFNFVRYMERLKDYDVDYGEANLNGENDDVVRIMTIHKSKGLEFPVVFLINTQKNFNNMDSNKKLIIDSDLGVGCDCLDADSRIRKVTAVKKAVALRMRMANLSEEQRILYVAMTRAKEKLYITGCVRDAQKGMERWQTGSGGKLLTYLDVTSHKNYLDMIMPAVLNEDSTFNYQVIKKDALEQMLAKAEQLQEIQAETVKKEWEEKTEFSYPYRFVTMPVKMTVSELKYLGQQEEDEPVQKLLEEEWTPTIPKFMNQEESVRGAQRGSAYHKLMELLDYDCCTTRETVTVFLQRCVEEGRITGEWADSIDVEDIVKFIESDLGQEFARAYKDKRLYRERQFVMGIPASMVDPSYDNEHQVLVQGVIDAYYEDEEGVVLVDYKTDRVPRGEEGRAVLVEHYHKQLEYYEEALFRMTGKKIRKKYIYSFCLGEAIDTDEK
ncbi:MAG: helicase-exonuclease AddAB subunit AddA [Lachnospiraceae bacterium]